MDEVTVTDQPEKSRYEVRIGGELAGFAEYRRTDALVDIFHTEVQPRFEGRGLGTRLAERAVADARAAGLRVVPTCPFIARYLQRNPG